MISVDFFMTQTPSFNLLLLAKHATNLRIEASKSNTYVLFLTIPQIENKILVSHQRRKNTRGRRLSSSHRVCFQIPFAREVTDSHKSRKQFKRKKIQPRVPFYITDLYMQVCVAKAVKAA